MKNDNLNALYFCIFVAYNLATEINKVQTSCFLVYSSAHLLIY